MFLSQNLTKINKENERFSLWRPHHGFAHEDDLDLADGFALLQAEGEAAVAVDAAAAAAPAPARAAGRRAVPPAARRARARHRQAQV